MKRLTLTTLAVAAAAAAAAGTAAADATNTHASCEGVIVSSATYPGEVAYYGRLLHDQLKALGIPPGVLDATIAKTKGAGPDPLASCLAEVPG
jgi:phage tail sheath gpL-like